MISDSEIVEIFKELGMKVKEEKQQGLHFHVSISPPTANSAIVSIIRPTAFSKYYVVTMAIEVDPPKLNKKVLREIGVELARLNVEFYVMPPDKPTTIQIAKLLYQEDLSKNELINTVTLVKNAGFIVFNILSGENMND
ncbi:DUF2299 domain-containing protein [Sulfolobus acidocaldarius]|uniref:Conserved protein n=4 Tax=Sulfolobus acidocaldarius TaxID=2285 RepID=Q4J730_SULAC|nr:DUF2299 domain-containing protein [Sulfolobus acidocaldarius]AAY81402.1 conserved protein [Sulfolobus acidocaldarius DSM 639]AGE72001.1 hypothetical protein SacN8_10255 [Sulfolobus acidocaldarius N8]AGE74317.1 hypothetical protein SacRon12I_10505 [Sulfolobus acidocaldarius Ron12/I]ALU29805.1 hypothetical protein ATY89_07545 [Sulfolobus acidocaldarius]ALU32544.1 hypothetical protein ATZ20_10565 [Sulfolobus acidocaldarius]